MFLISSLAAWAQDTDPSAWQTSYVVIAGEAEDFDLLETKAKNLSATTSIKYDAGGLIYNKEKGLIYPEDSNDEIYAGAYAMRRYDDNRISLEMRDHYFDNKGTGTKKMIIVAGIYGSKAEAAKRLKEVKAHAPSAYIRKTKIYMGCIH